jgi:replicative DNA helicase
VDIQEDPEAEMYWLQLADFYDFPHTQLYDSYQHLRELLLAADLKEIHNMMKAEVEVKGLQVNRKWCDIIERLKQSKNGGNFDP